MKEIFKYKTMLLFYYKNTYVYFIKMLYMLVSDGFVTILSELINMLTFLVFILNTVNINSYNLYKQKLFRVINNL